MNQRILLLIFSSVLLSFLAFSQEKCGSYKGYLQDDIKKYPEFYKNLEQQNAELEKSNKTFLQNIVRKKTVFLQNTRDFNAQLYIDTRPPSGGFCISLFRCFSFGREHSF